MISEILFSDVLTEGEFNHIRTVFSDPVVKKYLKIIGRNDLAELASLGASTLEDSEVAKKHALIQGKLSTITTLLNIKPKE